MNLKNFYLEDEGDFKNRIVLFKTDFSFTFYKLDQFFNECKFKSAIDEIKKVTKCQTPFEKMVNSINIFQIKIPLFCLNLHENKNFLLKN